MNHIKNKAFSLGELLMCLIIIGCISAMLIPAVSAFKPKKNSVMLKKSYYILESSILDMLYDNSSTGEYPDKMGFPSDLAYQSTNIADGSYDSGKKVCLQIAKRLNLQKLNGLNICSATRDYVPDFITVDGIFYSFDKNPICDPTYPYGSGTCEYPEELTCDSDTEYSNNLSDMKPYLCVSIDVNGMDDFYTTGSKANLINLSSSKYAPNAYPSENPKNFDRYHAIIHYDGKIDVLEEGARTLIMSNKVVK